MIVEVRLVKTINVTKEDLEYLYEVCAEGNQQAFEEFTQLSWKGNMEVVELSIEDKV
jgi:hypothetical protein